MSKLNIESALNNIDRLKSELSEMQQLINSLKTDVSSNLDECKLIIKDLITTVDEKNAKIEQLEKRRKELKSTIVEKKEIVQDKTHKKDVLQAEIQSKKQDLDQLSTVILEEEKKKTEVTSEIEGKEQIIDGLNRKIEEHKVLIEANKAETSEKVQQKETEIDELKDELNRIESRSKALKYLIKKDLINLPEISVIRSLKVPGVDTEQNIRKTSGVSDQIVRKILMDLDERGIIGFEPLSGKVKIHEKIDL